jgi:GntR family transcriptional regulator
MLPFRVDLATGTPPYAQVVYAVTRAIVSGQLQPGDSFPSVRVLSQELQISPNTAQKVVSTLRERGFLEVKPGVGTVIAKGAPANRKEREALLREDIERLVVEAKRLSLDLEQITEALSRHWQRLSEEEP